VIGELQAIFREILDRDDLTVDADTIPAQLPGWDSFAHVNSLFAIEERFGVQFSTQEFGRALTVGELVDLLQRKGAAA
jgi:acyl carrier protein